MPLQIIRQDILKVKADAVVNTTNENMNGAGGLDKAIHEAAGASLDKAVRKFVPLPPGEARVTKGYRLGCRYIIHISGPVWHGGDRNEREWLKKCYASCLEQAVRHGCETVAFPLISSGTNGFPKDEVLKIAVSAVTDFLFRHELTVYLCVFDKDSYSFSKKMFAEIKEFIDDAYAGSAVRNEGNMRRVCAQSAPLDIQPFAATETDMQATVCESAPPDVGDKESLREYLNKTDKPFAYKLFALIDERGMTDTECYKRANVDKKTFSKIRCHPKTYKPSKQTAVAFAIALRLDLPETQELLSSAGYTLSRSFVFDNIIRFFIAHQMYDIFEINEALFEFDQMLLGV